MKRSDIKKLESPIGSSNLEWPGFVMAKDLSKLQWPETNDLQWCLCANKNSHILSSRYGCTKRYLRTLLIW